MTDITKKPPRSAQELADAITHCIGRWHVITRYGDQIQAERREILECLIAVRDELRDKKAA